MESSSISAEVMALANEASTRTAGMRQRLRGIFELNRAYRRVFFDPAGNLTPPARAVLRDLIDAADFGRAARELDNGTLQVLEGKRRLLLHIFGRFRLPDGRIDQIEQDLRKVEDEQ
jgi:hypothetical protein